MLITAQKAFANSTCFVFFSNTSPGLCLNYSQLLIIGILNVSFVNLLIWNQCAVHSLIQEVSEVTKDVLRSTA